MISRRDSRASPRNYNEFDLTGEFSIGGMAKDYFSPTSSRFIWGAAAGALNVARGKSLKKGYDSGTLAHDIVGTVATAGGAGTLRAASLAWSKGAGGISRCNNMMRHFVKHGKGMGYKNPFTYTVGALKNIIRSQGGKAMSSVARSYTTSQKGLKKVTLTYESRIASYFKTKSLNRYR